MDIFTAIENESAFGVIQLMTLYMI